MRNFIFIRIALLSLGIFGASIVSAQSTEDPTNFVREAISVSIVEEFAPRPNKWEKVGTSSINDSLPDSSTDYSSLWHTYTGRDWIYLFGFGHLNQSSVQEDFSGWYYDLALGYIYLNPSYFPYIFQGRSNFWLCYYNTGDLHSRWFYNSLFGLWMNENDPLLQ